MVFMSSPWGFVLLHSGGGYAWPVDYPLSSRSVYCSHCQVDGDHIATVHCSHGSQWLQWMIRLMSYSTIGLRSGIVMVDHYSSWLINRRHPDMNMDVLRVDGDHIATVHCSPGSQHHVWIEWWYLCPLRGALSCCIVVVDMHGQSITRCLADLYIVHIAVLMEIISPLYIVAQDYSGCIEWSD